MSAKETVARNMRRLRVARGLSQESFADEVGIDRTYVSGIERGARNPSLSMIAKLAEKLKTTPAALLTPAPPGGTASSSSP